MIARNLLVGSVCLLMFAGCGGAAKPYPVSGRITLNNTNDEPVPRGILELSSGTFSAQAPIQGDGQFKLPGEGVPTGKYKVMLHGTAVGPTYAEPDQPLLLVIDPKYESEATPLTITVEPKDNVINIKVDGPPKAKS